MQNAVSDSSVSSVGLTLKGVTPHLLAVAMLQSVMEGDQALACVMYYGMPEADLKKLIDSVLTA